MRKAHWLIVSMCVLALAWASPAQAQQQGTQEGQPAQGLQQQAEQKAQEAKDLARQTQEKAQEARQLSDQAQQSQQQQQQRQGQLSTAGLFRASTLVGMEVRARDNEKVGKIQDLTIDSKNGRIVYAAISAGGFLGIGDKLVAVPWNSLQLHSDQENERYAVLNVQRQDFQNAPSFSENSWPTTQNQIWQVGTEREQMDTNVERQQHDQKMRDQQMREQQLREQQEREKQQREQQKPQQEQQQR